MTTKSEGSETPQELKEHGRHALADRPLPRRSLSLDIGSDDWTGPVPPADLLAEYAKISPELPDRIMRMFEAENLYQIERSRRIEKAARVSRRLSTAVLVLVTILTAITAATLLRQDEDAIALVVGLAAPVSACVAGVAFFLSSRRRDNVGDK